MARARRPPRGIAEKTGFIMAQKFHVEVGMLAPRYTPVAKVAAFETEGCLGCLKCVKRDSCIYEVYKKRAFDAGHGQRGSDDAGTHHQHLLGWASETRRQCSA